MRGTHPRLAAGWLLALALVLALFLIAPTAGAANGLPSWPWICFIPADPQMAAIAAAVRAEEAKFQDIEYVVRIVVRDRQRQDGTAPSDITTIARHRVVLQGDRTFLWHDAFERVGAVKFHHDETSAYDSERTRTVIAGNCVNIHLGRWRHPAMVPAHSLPLAHYGVNFPLSIYLSGTGEIHAYLGYPPGLVDSIPNRTFRKVETRLEGEEMLDGLRCLKVRADRWYQTNEGRFTQHLWLAPERNYHCVKEEHEYGAQRQEMRVHELREVARGVWFPAKISVVVSQTNAQNQGKSVVMSRTETTVEELSLAPRHEAAFFRDVAIPDGLPVFTMKDRRLVGSIQPEPLADDGGNKQLAELAARVAEQEKRYDALEIKARTRTTYPRTSSSVQRVRHESMSDERSIIRGDVVFSSSHQRVAGPGGWQDTMFQINAYDGEWGRSFWSQGSRDNPQGIGFLLRRGRAPNASGAAIGIHSHRPHMLILRNNWSTASLADLITANFPVPAAAIPLRFRSCGAAEVDGHPCIKVRGDVKQERINQANSLVLYLATDRNDIPVKVEHYGDYYGQSAVPTSVSHCGDFREITPGVWYPFRITDFTFDIWAMIGQGWAVPTYRRETTIETVHSAARIDDAVFRDVTAPAGTVVHVMDELGQYVGQVQQPEDGIPWLSLKRYLELSSQARGQPQVQQLRRRATDALIGQPAPAFPRKATWLNGRPLTWESLRGRIVVLGCWAEWSEACREELERLNQLHRAGPKDRLAIVGVHPPGSEPAEIAKMIDTLKLDFPICVDATAAAGASAWGELLGRLGVRSVPHTVVVNAEGEIVASGHLTDILDQVHSLIRKAR
jgi:peroxiredoxin